MKPALTYRLIGLCVLSTLTIATFDLKRVWWEFSVHPSQTSQSVPVILVLEAIAAVVASFGCWREKPWGYVLAVLLCAMVNIVAVWSFYSQPVGFRFGDIFAVGLSAAPVAVGLIAGLMLLVSHYSKKETPNQPPAPTAPSGRG